MDWNDFSQNTLNDYKVAMNFDIEEYKTELLEVNETISELAYLTHDYFRYYGKFPSKIGRYIIDTLISEKKIDPTSDFLFDNYAGSGTSLVEAKLAGFDSGAIDINPFAVLASNVKTNNYDISILTDMWMHISRDINAAAPYTNGQIMLFDECANEDSEHILNFSKKIYQEFPDVEKWFVSETIFELSIIKYFLLKLPYDKYREFFTLAFFAIIRRVSRAHDGEVRPHVNKKKKIRRPIDAFTKKVTEMIETMQAWNNATDHKVKSCCYVCSNIDSNKVGTLIDSLKLDYKKELGLVVSHPPYLNCFDYIPVYKLKFLWAFGFDEIYGEADYSLIKKSEIKSYPASTDKLINAYFQHNIDSYKVIYNNLKNGGYCCIVIGDCTINKELLSVHKIFIKALESIGFKVDRIVYRTTSYGLGRYAYKHKADYNDNEDGKKDAILFLYKS